jgi:hypothetical protein
MFMVSPFQTKGSGDKPGNNLFRYQSVEFYMELVIIVEQKRNP